MCGGRIGQITSSMWLMVICQSVGSIRWSFLLWGLWGWVVQVRSAGASMNMQEGNAPGAPLPIDRRGGNSTPNTTHPVPLVGREPASP